MTDLDLHTPLDLELAEQRMAAAARALSNDATLRFRGHLIYQGEHLAPARASYVQPDVDIQDLEDLRGSADATAARVSGSRRDIYAQFRPEGDFARMVYEFLEQFRVEALVPEDLPGARANIARLFADWSERYVGEGLLETEVGLLLYTVFQMCRSRILSVAMSERVEDDTEATRAALYEILGPGLRELRGSIHDQAAFAGHARAISERIGELIEASLDEDADRRMRSTVLSMLSEGEDRETGARQRHDDAEGALQEDLSRGYSIYTTQFDQEVDVDDVVLPHAQQVTRAELDEILREHGQLATYINRGVAALFPEPQDPWWESDQEEGRLDPRALSRLATGALDPRVFRRERHAPSPRAAVTFLIDCSGSMKAAMPQVAALVDLFARALDRVDVATEVLGFTTAAWSGGRAHQRWMADGRPAQPGRLNEASHIIFKDASSGWRAERKSISGLLWTPIFREGIDGEALDWAADRLLGIPVPSRHLVLICDGSPMDSATSLANGEEYLDVHLQEVAEALEARGQIDLFGLGIGHDMSSFLAHSRIVDPERIVDRSVAHALLRAFAR